MAWIVGVVPGVECCGRDGFGNGAAGNAGGADGTRDCFVSFADGEGGLVNATDEFGCEDGGGGMLPEKSF